MVRWLQLEANPKVLDKYAGELRRSDGDAHDELGEGYEGSFAFADVVSTDREVLKAMYGQAWLTCCQGIVLVAPMAALDTAYRELGSSPAENQKYLFIKQYIDNACGAIAMLHLVGNLEGKGREARPTSGSSPSQPGSILRTLCSLASPEERGHWLEASEEAAALHSRYSAQGDTTVPAVEAETELHFVTLLRGDTELIVFDGRLSQPVTASYGSGDFWDTALSFISLLSREASTCSALALSIN